MFVERIPPLSITPLEQDKTSKHLTNSKHLQSIVLFLSRVPIRLSQFNGTFPFKWKHQDLSCPLTFSYWSIPCLSFYVQILLGLSWTVLHHSLNQDEYNRIFISDNGVQTSSTEQFTYTFTLNFVSATLFALRITAFARRQGIVKVYAKWSEAINSIFDYISDDDVTTTEVSKSLYSLQKPFRCVWFLISFSILITSSAPILIILCTSSNPQNQGGWTLWLLIGGQIYINMCGFLLHCNTFGILIILHTISNGFSQDILNCRYYAFINMISKRANLVESLGAAVILGIICVLDFMVIYMICDGSGVVQKEATEGVTKLRDVDISNLNPVLQKRALMYFTSELQNPTCISPGHFFVLNRYTLTSIVTVVTTYIFVLFQFQKAECANDVTNSTFT